MCVEGGGGWGVQHNVQKHCYELAFHSNVIKSSSSDCFALMCINIIFNHTDSFQKERETERETDRQTETAEQRETETEKDTERDMCVGVCVFVGMCTCLCSCLFTY